LAGGRGGRKKNRKTGRGSVNISNFVRIRTRRGSRLDHGEGNEEKHGYTGEKPREVPLESISAEGGWQQWDWGVT